MHSFFFQFSIIFLFFYNYYINQFYGEQQKTYDKTEGKVGETVIAKKPVEKKESNKDVGDYVDYEDVKD